MEDQDWFRREIPKKSKDSAVIEVKDVDIICKLLNEVVYVVEEKIYHKLAFCDIFKNVYYAEYAGHFPEIFINDIVKLRSISVIIAGETRKITFANYSAIMRIDKGFADYSDIAKKTASMKVDKEELEEQEFQELHLDKLQKTQIALNTYAFTNGDVNPAQLKESMVRGFPVLENFDHGDDDFLYTNNFGFKFFSKRGSAVLKRYATGNYFTFKELFEIQDEILMKPEAAQKYQHQKYLVRGFILATEYDFVLKNSKLYSPSQNKV